MAIEAFSDLSFFALLMKQGSLAGAAQEMGVTPPSASKRLAALEARPGGAAAQPHHPPHQPDTRG